jgi:hypothetical protein
MLILPQVILALHPEEKTSDTHSQGIRGMKNERKEIQILMKEDFYENIA